MLILDPLLFREIAIGNRRVDGLADVVLAEFSFRAVHTFAVHVAESLRKGTRKGPTNHGQKREGRDKNCKQADKTISSTMFHLSSWVIDSFCRRGPFYGTTGRGFLS
jgi:hypothetical protein